MRILTKPVYIEKSSPESSREDAASLFFPDRYDDEPPMFDGPIFEPDADDLAWLQSQLADCQDMPDTLAELQCQINAMKRALVLSEVAAFLCRPRDDHEDQEYRGSQVGHDCQDGGDR